MTDTTVLPADEQPANGVWVDPCDVIANPTPQEVFDGVQLGLLVDTDDDEDNGIAFRTLVTTPQQAALAKAQSLKKIMLAHGVPEVSIELVEGRPSAHGRWDALFVVADMSHHTVSRYRAGILTPILALCKRGRSDLPGPLCNGYGGWDLCYRIITFGYANHPGAGGPKTVPALTVGKFTIPKDSARRYAWGTEWEGGLDAKDWDKVLTNPRNGKKMTMREFMGRSNAALEAYHKIHRDAHLEHSTWTSRKIDRLGYTAARGILEKSPFRSPAKPKPPKAMKPAHEHIVFSPSRFDRTPASLVAAVKAYLERRTKILLTEVASDKRSGPLKTMPGWGLVNPDQPGECAIMYRKNHSLLLREREVGLTKKPNDVWPNGFSGTEGVFQNKRTGQTHAMLVAHMPARVQGAAGWRVDPVGKKNRAAYEDAVNKMSVWAKAMRENPNIDYVSVYADWNLDWRSKWVRDYLGPKFPGLVNTWTGHVPDKGGTHDSRLIDYGFSNAKTTNAELMVDDDSSDHRPSKIHQVFRAVMAKVTRTIK